MSLIIFLPSGLKDPIFHDLIRCHIPYYIIMLQIVSISMMELFN